jgi:nucleotide-binding universal stress UspA family protein
VLVAQARSADLLVVGSRGLGGFRELLLGSVSQACVHHAHCPVVVVPDPARLAREDDARVPAEASA